MSLFQPAIDPNPARYLWLNPTDYDRKIVVDSNGQPIYLDVANWRVTVDIVLKEKRGININITVKNVSNQILNAPNVRIPTGMYHPQWSEAGADSNFRHVLNYSCHDSYGMRMVPVSYPTVPNAATDKFGDPNAIYGVNWFAPCLAIENWATGRVSWGTSLMSVSTNYPYPFKIYGDFDAAPSYKAFFKLEGNVDVTGLGAEDTFAPNEERSWTVWLRFENYDPIAVGFGSSKYRAIAALRSFEPYFVWYWNTYGDYNHGPRVSGRIYGVNLAGPNAPKAYFAPKDNPRRYFLFSTQQKESLNGQLPLPGQSYIHPENASGWKELLDAIADVPSLKAYGYQGIMIFNPAGWGNADLGGNPSFFTNLPIKLRNTLGQLKQWEKDNELRVFFSASNALNKINRGNFNDLAEPFNIEDSLHIDSISKNFDQGGLKSCSGLALFDLPNAKVNSWPKEYARSWRQLYPSDVIAGYSHNSTELYSYVIPSYIDRSEFLTKDYSKGGRDWFLDVLFMGADPWVYMPLSQWYADYGNSANTDNDYDSYVQKIEKEHQVVAVTVGRLVRKECLAPNKLKWKEQFLTFAALGVSGTLCTEGDPDNQIGPICESRDLLYTYTSNVPTSLRYMKAVYAFDGLYDWVAGNSWIPGLGGTGDPRANCGDSLLWLWQDDKLLKAKQTIENNLNFINRPSEGVFVNSMNIEPDYQGYIYVNWEPYHIAGARLLMYRNYQFGDLINATSGSGLSPKTLRNWWIWVMDQVQPGWASGKTLDQQDIFLQQTWVERWTVWMNMIVTTFKEQRPGITHVGLYGGLPNYGTWDLAGLDFGTTNPDLDNGSLGELERNTWKPFLEELDFLGPSMYLWDPVPDWDSPLYYWEAGRVLADPIQVLLYSILTVRMDHSISQVCGKPVIPFIWTKHIRAIFEARSNILPLLYKNKYLSGCQGCIWWDAVVISDAEASMQSIANYWYPVTRYIDTKNAASLIEIAPPDPIQVSTGTLPIGEGGNVSQGGTVVVTDIARSKKGKLVKDGLPSFVDTIEGFGVQRYVAPISGSVGDPFPIDYSTYDVVAIANSIDGTLEIPTALTKYNKIELDIINPTLNHVGMPHWVLEDTFEWVNSGMPSHLSQVRDSNLIMAGLSAERISPGIQELTAPVYQAKFVVPCDSSWYDKVNSTIDYDVFLDHGNENLSLPYPNAILHIPEAHQVWVGGYGGVLSIDKITKNISSVPIQSDRTLLIKDLKMYGDKIYILDEAKLFIYDIPTNKITKDTALGLPNKLHSFASVFGSNLVVGAKDGIYARKITGTTWKRVVAIDSAVNVISSPDAILAVADDGQSYYSTDGFTWTRVGVINDKIVNKIKKYRSNILFATNEGLYQDGGSFYTGHLSLQLLNVFSDIQKAALLEVNDVDSSVTKAVIGLSDGRYVVYGENFVAQPNSKLPTIHKVLIVDDEIWLFGYNQFRITSETFVRKLASGFIVT